ncbi:hypothetical protein J2W37_001240 [Variovorax paradoxus]|uniref:Uncharacterized protein n=1 Tax=Variovorax paradoxus TaxID=34073 RepID=A0AAE3XWY7_VARPD|nr:hypothetical protein [Variovorax paradoxus]MDR6426220.1 hypothetical protein [Variovorax paradoxus]
MGAGRAPIASAACPHPNPPPGGEGEEKESQNAGTSEPLNCVSMKLFTSGDW